MWRTFYAVAIAVCVSGCTQPVNGVRKETDDDPVILSLRALAEKACQDRDRIAGERIVKLAGEVETGKVRFDGPLLDQIKKINTDATIQCFSELEIKLKASLDPAEKKFSEKKVASALREYGMGRVDAGTTGK